MVEIVVQNINDGRAWDISELVTSITWETSIDNQPGKLTFSYIDDGKVVIVNGSPVTFKYNKVNIFYGFVFKRGRTNGETISITCYDQMRYLKNKDTSVFTGLTASQIFSKVCNDYQLNHQVITPSWYVVPQVVQDNKTLFEMIEYGVDMTLINACNWHVIYDDFGTLKFDSYTNMATNIFIGDSSGLSAYDFQASIDDDTYNQIKLTKENKETQKREVWIVKDSSTIAKWGLLQHYETVDEDANEAQIKNRAEQLLKVKNRETRQLKLESLDGKTNVRAGSGIVVGIKKLEDEGLSKYQYFMVSKAKHSFTQDSHTMTLEMRLNA